MEERYILTEAATMLGVSRKTLEGWLARDGMSTIVRKQRMETDMRAHYLTRPQVEQLAALHRRALRGEYDMRERVAALERRMERLEALIAQQGDTSSTTSST